MKKKLSLLILLCFSIFLVACTNTTKNSSNLENKNVETAENIENQEPKTIKIGISKSPASLPVIKMIEDKALGENITLESEIWDNPEALIALVQGKEHDLFAFPLTVAGKLYNKGLPVQLINVNTWGLTYFLTSDPNFKTWEDLKGKTIYVPLQSSPPDAITQYFLNSAGLNVGTDVIINYASAQEIAQLLISGQAEYATLIEPQVTGVIMQNKNMRVALSFEDEWQRINNTESKLPNIGFGGSKTFIDENPELVEKFQEEYKKALDWVVANPTEAAQLAETHLGLKAPMVQKAIPNMGLEFKTASDAKEELITYYEFLNDFNPEMIGGLPDEGLYYEK